MNTHTKLAQRWLDKRYSRDAHGNYLAHQPIDGVATDRSEPNKLLRLARTYHLLQLLQNLEFRTVLDVGGGEGYLGGLIRDLCRAGTVHSSDLSAEACQRAGEIFNIQGLAADATTLPLADNSYDLVICSEVLEHLSRPVAVINELARIARKYVVITTEQFCPLGEMERTLRSWTLDSSYPHADLNWFTAQDFSTVLGGDIRMVPQYRNLGHLFAGEALTKEQLEKALPILTATTRLGVDTTGVFVIAPRNGATIPTDLYRSKSQNPQILNRLLAPPDRKLSNEGTTLEESLLSRLRCPQCHGTVTRVVNLNGLRCDECRRQYGVKNGVPLMFFDEPRGIPQVEDESAILGAGEHQRERRIRELIKKLHGHDSIRNSPLKQKSAEQLLRVLWLCRRDEPLNAKFKRVYRRVTRQRPLEHEEMETALFSAKGS
jgi:ubiquinone/menaquinone biosynthesis C-methylase UbiE/uncharacterized protein YbaR (Trm112 family)